MKSTITAFFILISISASAQLDPLYAQYFNNPLLINPAFAGSNERLFAGLGYRKQWSGLEGSPTTFSMNAHTSLVDNRVGAGVIVLHDKIGEFANTQCTGAFAYRLKFTNYTLSFGMQAGLIRYSTNANNIHVLNPDPRFAPFSQTQFNLGAGLLLKSERYAVGFSVPHFLANEINQEDQAVQVYSQNYYCYASYLFYANERITIKPLSLLRLTKGAPLSADININATIDRHYTAGLFTRNMNTYGMIVQAVIRDLRFSYVFELPGKRSALNFNTHEIGIALSIGVLSSHNKLSNGLY